MYLPILTTLLAWLAAPPPATVQAPPDNARRITRECLGGKARFDVYLVDLDEQQLDILHNGNAKAPRPITLDQVRGAYKKSDNALQFATNGGMYMPDYGAQGLLIRAGHVEYPLNTKEQPRPFTNFYSIPPNGVFYLTHSGVPGIAPRDRVPSLDSLTLATQSGPMLVLDGQLNPGLDRASETSRKLRSGVGVKQGRNSIMGKYEMVFIISVEPINFECFARAFLYYGCTDALYLDGVISEAYFAEPYTCCQRRGGRQGFGSVLTVMER